MQSSSVFLVKDGPSRTSQQTRHLLTSTSPEMLSHSNVIVLGIVGSLAEVGIFFRNSKRQKHFKTNCVATCLAWSLFLYLSWTHQDFLAFLTFCLFFLLHSRTVFALLLHPWEIPPLIGYAFRKPDIEAGSTPDQVFCYKKLKQVSRSFYPVTMALDAELREAICIFYLVCRGLDTIEDDMKPEIQAKTRELQDFYKHLDEGKPWNIKGYGDVPTEIDLLERFEHVISVFNQLDPKYQKIISKCAQEMGSGMAEFLDKNVVSLEDYNKYCWYVAGLVGEGLSLLFVASGREGPSVQDYPLYSGMGLFLQKVNITRDFHEDINVLPRPRMFYPQEIWGKYAKSLKDFLLPSNIKPAVTCLNEMVTDAMMHAPQVLTYLSQLKDPHIFKFCAIPQVMAIATLLEVYNNPCVFRGEVKIRRSLALYIATHSNNMKQVYSFFLEFAQRFSTQVPTNDPNGKRLKEALVRIKDICQRG